MYNCKITIFPFLFVIAFTFKAHAKQKMYLKMVSAKSSVMFATSNWYKWRGKQSDLGLHCLTKMFIKYFSRQSSVIMIGILMVNNAYFFLCGLKYIWNHLSFLLQLKVREHPVLGPYVEGLSTFVVNSFDDVEVRPSSFFNNVKYECSFILIPVLGPYVKDFIKASQHFLSTYLMMAK